MTANREKWKIFWKDADKKVNVDVCFAISKDDAVRILNICIDGDKEIINAYVVGIKTYSTL